MTIIITDEDVRRLLPMSECIAAMRVAFRDFADGVIPRNALPLAAAFRPDAPQRMHQPIRVVDVVEVWPNLAAQPALGDRILQIAAKADSPAVAHLGDHPTSVGAIVRTDAANLQ